MHSLITITYNNHEELIQTITSINSASNRSSIEHIIINGGSSKSTEEFLISQHKGPYISEPDKGISDALVTGDSISFLNSGDILIDKDYYKKCESIFQKNNAVNFIYAQLNIRKSDGSMSLRGFHKGLIGMPFPHPTLVVRKSISDKVGPFDKKYKVCMDFDWVCKMLKITNVSQYIETPVIEMDGSGISNTMDDKGAIENIQILKKHGKLTFKALFKQLNVYTKVKAKKILK